MPSSLKFGTSGLRGLVSDMTGEQLRPYLDAFLALLIERKEIGQRSIVVGMDLRESSPAIARIVGDWTAARGLAVDDLGPVPTPALAYYCSKVGKPGIMITGSHIPSDRNGIKFYFASREISKEEEMRIVVLRESAMAGELSVSLQLPSSGKGAALANDVADEAAQLFMDRYLSAFPTRFLSGKRILVYQHSSAARDVLTALVEAFGGEAIAVERSNVFVAVDTENLHRLDDLGRLVQEHRADALVSTDGDGDRPLMLDEQGCLIRGDLLGCIGAAYLKATQLVTPVTSSSIVELSHRFPSIERTKVGSAFVISALLTRQAQGAESASVAGKNAADETAVGFEANGGLILASTVELEPGLKALEPLLTRDSILPLLLALLASVRKGCSLSGLREDWPARANESGLISPIVPEASAAILQILGNEVALSSSVRRCFEHLRDIDFVPTSTDMLDGLKCISADHEVVHFRPSGNAPEFRVYTESSSPDRADLLKQFALDVVRSMVM
jgi:phosphomannomutase